MSEQKDKYINPDQGNPALEGYRQDGKGLVEENKSDNVLDDSTDVAREATVPDDVINSPTTYEQGNITGQVEVSTEGVKGDFAPQEQRSTDSGALGSTQVQGPDAGSGTSNTIRDIEDTDHDKSYMPGSGAVRTKEDRIGKGTVDPDSIPPGAGVI